MLDALKSPGVGEPGLVVPEETEPRHQVMETATEFAIMFTEEDPLKPAGLSDDGNDPDAFRPESAEHSGADLKPSRPYQDLVEAAAGYLGLPPSLLHAIIAAESSYRPDAESTAGAIGLMQLIPEAGARDAYEYLYGRRGTPTSEGLRRPEVNIWLGAAYLHLLRSRHLSDIAEPARDILAVAAYNWGIGKIKENLRQGRLPRTREEAHRWVREHCPDETIAYVERVFGEQKLAMR